MTIKPPDIDHDERRFYYLVFGEPGAERPLGGCVVEVSGADAMIAWLIKPDMHNQDVGPWLAAAIREAWLHGINPGGAVLGGQVTADAPAWVQRLEPNRLYSDEEMERLSKPH
jgi:hypothetical protein